MKIQLTFRSAQARSCATLLLLALILLSGACKRGAKLTGGEPAYVAVPQVNLRDRLSAVYNKVGVVKNGEKVEILEKSKRFVRVRTSRKEEGWMEARYLVGPEIFEAFATMEKENVSTPVQGHGVARAELNMHVKPGRETEHLYRIDGGAKVDILKRSTAEKAGPAKPASVRPAAVKSVAPAKPGGKQPAGKEPAAPPPPVVEDWWLVRDLQHRTGWVLARLVDIDVPMKIAEYAEGQRIMACFQLNEVVDSENGQQQKVAQYLVLASEPKDGLPYDFSQLRVFTWNTKRHRYETAYRERNLEGVFPVTVGHAVFEKEGDLPFFVVRAKDSGGNIMEKKYKLNGPIVRRVASAEEQAREAADKAARRAAAPAKKTQKTHQRKRR